jgi:hypothetical protein
MSAIHIWFERAKVEVQLRLLGRSTMRRENELFRLC